MVILACVVLLILSGNGDILTQQKTAGYLQRFSYFVQEEAIKQDKEAKFQYGNISMKGWGYDTQAVVSDVSYEILEKSLIDSQRISLSTQSMTVKRQGGMGPVQFLFESPINVIKNSQMTNTITPSSAIIYSYSENKASGNPQLFHSIKLPEQMIIAPVPAAGEVEVVKERVVLSFGPNNLIKAETNADNSASTISYFLPEIKIVNDNSSSISIADLTVNGDMHQVADNKMKGRFEWRATDIVVHDGNRHSKPHSLIFDAEYTGDRLRMDYLRLMPSLDNIDFSVHKIAFMGEDFNIIATGQLSFASSDPLPSGALDVEVLNAENLLSGDLISMPFKAPLRSVLKKISGVKGEFAERTPIAIKREKNGVLYIGGITFEELTASVIGELFRLNTPLTAKDKPAEEMPVAPPAEVAPPVEAAPQVETAPPMPQILQPEPESNETYGDQ